MDKNWRCRWATSLGELESTAYETWGIGEYESQHHQKNPVVFFGLYGLPDFYEIWRHKGEKAILWTGSDIRHFIKGYWLDDKGSIKMSVVPLAKWIKENCESYVENVVEYEALKKFGIESKIVPSFLGDVKNFDISFKSNIKNPKVYLSVSGNDFKLYQWPLAIELAEKYSDVEFHFYGNTIPFSEGKDLSNVFFHGRVSKEQFNSEIKEMQGALRLLPFEGCSELLVKSALMGQWPVSAIPYPYTLSIKELGELRKKTRINIEGRRWFLENLNKFPWNLNK